MLDSIKFIFKGVATFITGLSVDLQALHQIFFQVCVNLHNRLEIIFKIYYLLYTAPKWTSKASKQFWREIADG